MTKEKLSKMVGEFIYCWGNDFFIKTSEGNFVWKDPDYGGDGTIKSYNGNLSKFLKEIGVDFGRSKGTKFIGDYCGNFTFVG